MTELRSWLEAMPLVAILRGVRPEEVVDIGRALVEEGLGIIEVPLNSPRPFDSITALADDLGERALIGAGTVLDPADVDRVAAAGGSLIVTPNAGLAVVAAAKAQGLVAIPGFATPTEGFSLIDAGADAIKLFPAEANPPPVVKAMRAVFPPEIPVLAVGSITPEKIGDYWAAGTRGFGLGGSLYKPGDDAATVAGRVAGFREAIERARSMEV